MPESVARLLFEASDCEIKALSFFEGAGHGGAFEEDRQRYISDITNFLERID
jgi:hypothetical protein